MPACVCCSTGLTPSTVVAQRVTPPLKVLRIDVERSCNSRTIAGRRSSAKFCRPQLASSVGPASLRPPSDTVMPPNPVGPPPAVPPLAPPAEPALPPALPPAPAGPMAGATTLAQDTASKATMAEASSAGVRAAATTDSVTALGRSM